MVLLAPMIVVKGLMMLTRMTGCMWSVLAYQSDSYSGFRVYVDSRGFMMTVMMQQWHFDAFRELNPRDREMSFMKTNAVGNKECLRPLLPISP